MVTEGQAYALTLAGITLNTLQTNDPNFAWAAARARELYLGWRRMLIRTSSLGACQSLRACSNNTSFCLPHWKWNSDLSSPLGTGSAADADVDAIVGLSLLGNAPVSWANEAESDVIMAKSVHLNDLKHLLIPFRLSELALLFCAMKSQRSRRRSLDHAGEEVLKRNSDSYYFFSVF